MSPYADSNFFTRLYLPLPDRDQAIELANQAKARANVPPLPNSFLHRVEILNAFQLHVFAGKTRGQSRVTPEQVAAAHAAFFDDITSGDFLRNVALDLDPLERQVEELSLRHTGKHGFRVYDLMHVGSALLLGCDTFWTFDQKATKLASLEGLHVI